MLSEKRLNKSAQVIQIFLFRFVSYDVVASIKHGLLVWFCFFFLSLFFLENIQIPRRIYQTTHTKRFIAVAHAHVNKNTLNPNENKCSKVLINRLCTQPTCNNTLYWWRNGFLAAHLMHFIPLMYATTHNNNCISFWDGEILKKKIRNLHLFHSAEILGLLLVSLFAQWYSSNAHHTESPPRLSNGDESDCKSDVTAERVFP